MHDFTINAPEEMKRLILLGADGIMTDYPHLLKQVYGEYRAERKRETGSRQLAPSVKNKEICKQKFTYLFAFSQKSSRNISASPDRKRREAS